MKKFKNFILFNIFLFLISCGTLKSAFENQKKKSTDEFLVEKKSPLVMPPDFDELPIPKEQEEKLDTKENGFKILISKENVENKPDNNKNVNKSFEESLLEKIKNN
tara:strand:+ start:55 stop:372 length:318 start_codon:yes stop_codon:yes gene_type:complete